MRVSITVPRRFNFKRTVISHGWCALLPFSCDQERWQLGRVLDVPDSPPVTVNISKPNKEIHVEVSRRLNKRQTASVIRDVRHMLRLDDNLESFYRTVRAVPDFEWIAHSGAGRLLRAPTVFEDLVKMICTTNCSWSLTEKMVTGLVGQLGTEGGDGRRGFPTPAAMASVPTEFYVKEIKAGYRSAYLKELADRVAEGSLDVEAWATSVLPTTELMKQIRDVKGVGPYASENVLKLLGRYDGLALDSWTRAKFYEVRNRGRKTSDKQIGRYYSRFGEWRGLALWCDMTRDWLE